MRSDLVKLFCLLGFIFIAVIPCVHKDIVPVILDICIGVVCFALAYATSHAPIMEEHQEVQ